MRQTLKNHSSLLAIAPLFLSLTFSRIDYLQLDNVTRFCFHLGTVAYTKTMALRVTLNYYCLNIRYDPTSFVLTSTHQLCVHAAHRGCESSTVTDTTQGDFTTHSTKGWILDHTVLRNWEKKKNQCNYSEKNDFCYKCRSSGEPSLNCMGRDWLYAGISVIIMSANSYKHREECR